MPITVTALTADKQTLAPGGDKANVTISSTDPDKTFVLTVSAEGSSKTLSFTVHEPETFSVTPSDVGTPGKVVATLDAAGVTLATVALGATPGTLVITTL